MSFDPANAQELASLLRRHRITLQHRLGQNFLIDPVLRDAIADAAVTDGVDEILEVGAGVGTLTIALATRARRVVAVEFDRALIPPFAKWSRATPRWRSCRLTSSATTWHARFPRGVR